MSRRRRTRSGGASHQQQITVVDQMAAQPHIPYAILPKRFEPKQVSGNGFQQQSRSSNNNFNGNNRRGGRRPAAPRHSQRSQNYYDDQWIDEQEEDLWLEPLQPRRFNQRPNRNYGPSAGYYGPRVIPQKLLQKKKISILSSFSSSNVRIIIMIHIPMVHRIAKDKCHFIHVVVSYIKMMAMFHLILYHPMISMNGKDLMLDQNNPYISNKHVVELGRNHSFNSKYLFYLFCPYSSYGRNDNGFIHDDHRVNGSSRQSRNGKPSTPTRNGKAARSPRNKGQPKRQNSRQRKQRNQNSKSEGKKNLTLYLSIAFIGYFI